MSQPISVACLTSRSSTAHSLNFTSALFGSSRFIASLDQSPLLDPQFFMSTGSRTRRYGCYDPIDFHNQSGSCSNLCPWIVVVPPQVLTRVSSREWARFFLVVEYDMSSRGTPCHEFLCSVGYDRHSSSLTSHPCDGTSSSLTSLHRDGLFFHVASSRRSLFFVVDEFDNGHPPISQHSFLMPRSSGRLFVVNVGKTLNTS
jgi:hypothetical protein